MRGAVQREVSFFQLRHTEFAYYSTRAVKMTPTTKHAAIALTVVALTVASKFLVPSVLNARFTSQNFNQNGVIQLGDPWQRDVELTHAADQYDCLESATKQLAAQLSEFILDNSRQFKETIIVHVRFEGEPSLSDLPARTLSSLEHYLPLALLDAAPQVKVQLSRSTSSPDLGEADTSLIELSLTTQAVGTDNILALHADSLLLAGSIYFDQQVRTLKPLQIASKSWIGQWTAYRNRPSHQHLRQYRAETMDQAQLLVCRELASKWRGQRSHTGLVSQLSQDQATEIIQQQLPRLGLIVDQFEQTFQLTMQDGSQLPALTRSALLVDQSPQKLEPVHALLDSSSQRRAQQFWSRFRLLCPIAIVLMIGTLGLDRLTLGYYTWRIRSGAVLIASVIFLLS